MENHFSSGSYQFKFVRKHFLIGQINLSPINVPITISLIDRAPITTSDELLFCNLIQQLQRAWCQVRTAQPNRGAETQGSDQCLAGQSRSGAELSWLEVIDTRDCGDADSGADYENTKVSELQGTRRGRG